MDHCQVKSRVPIPIPDPGSMRAIEAVRSSRIPIPGQIGIPRFPEIPAKWGIGESRLHSRSRPNRDWEVPAASTFTAKSGRARDGGGNRAHLISGISGFAAGGGRAGASGAYATSSFLNAPEHLVGMR